MNLGARMGRLESIGGRQLNHRRIAPDGGVERLAQKERTDV